MFCKNQVNNVGHRGNASCLVDYRERTLEKEAEDLRDDGPLREQQ